MIVNEKIVIIERELASFLVGLIEESIKEKQ
ncbi:hypothetical protein SAMN05192529_11875 [Arachidicoccus rhizosphaerae]|uniref:Uncharacterized protein n=1 Tax=Arachidicoccus rhizosphaerae TaxID=551991 RepID=A0A1H4B689_9BACT|nr:hypothetical protein SAMN05192529_11875 [Arachidicoccus rhizosphaerae]